MRCVCDAGSEKTKTDVATTHGQMIESNNINRSLLVLGRPALRPANVFYPYFVFFICWYRNRNTL